ncbi:MAG: type II toxin-antitoxin system VapC family toxin [Actinomycetota bacterium]|nr:type II toxin-antitoxin system VapC family toxin [Actinomycetota bacterium]
MVKLYVEEDGTKDVQRAVDSAESVVTSAVAYPEARSAFARLERDGYLSPEEHRAVVAALDREWPSYEVMDVTRNTASVAGTLAARHLLRGFDAVHLASAVVLRAAREISYREAHARGASEASPPEVLLMTYDGPLLTAAKSEDLTHEPPGAGGEGESA